MESYVDSQHQIDSDRFELDFSNLDKKKFKIKKRGKGSDPRLYITPPNIEKNGTDRIFLNIYETYENKYVTYYFEFNDKGNIINWCCEMNEIIRTY